MLFYVRSTQNLDFILQLANKNFKCIPHFKKNNDGFYLNHPFIKMLKSNNVKEDITWRNGDTVSKVTRNYLWSYDRIKMKYKEDDYVGDFLQNIEKRTFKVDLYNGTDIIYDNMNEKNLLSNFMETFKEADKKFLEGTTNVVRYEFVKQNIEKMDEIIDGVKKTAKVDYSPLLKKMIKRKRQVLAQHKDVIKDYIEGITTETDGAVFQVIRNKSDYNKCIIDVTNLIEKFKLEREKKHLNKKINKHYDVLLLELSQILKVYKDFIEDDNHMVSKNDTDVRKESIERITEDCKTKLEYAQNNRYTLLQNVIEERIEKLRNMV